VCETVCLYKLDHLGMVWCSERERRVSETDCVFVQARPLGYCVVQCV